MSKCETSKQLYRKRKEPIDRSFADDEELHKLSLLPFTRMGNVKIQTSMTATVQNTKKVAIHLDHLEKLDDSLFFDL